MKKEVEEFMNTLELIIYDQTIEKISLDLIDKSIEVDDDEIKIFIVSELINIYDKYNLTEKKIKLLKFLTYNKIIEKNLQYIVQLFFSLHVYKPKNYENDLSEIEKIISSKKLEDLFNVEISNILFQNKKFYLCDFHASKIAPKKNDEIYLNALYNRIFSNYHLKNTLLMNSLHKNAKKYFDKSNENVQKNEFILNILMKKYIKAFNIINELANNTLKYKYQIDAFVLAILLNKYKMIKKYTILFQYNNKKKIIEDINSSIFMLGLTNLESIKIFNTIDRIDFKDNL